MADTGPLRLVFSGGTALSRAHRLISRMSEDIDLKIIGDTPPTRPQLRALRQTISTALLGAGFQFDPENREQCVSRNSTRYTVWRLPYEPIAAGEGVLRPEIQIEAAVWPLRLPTVPLPVQSFTSEANQFPPEVAMIPCVSVTETAAEKFVALTRRVGAELAHPDQEPDVTLVRHLYDLHVLREHYEPAEVMTLAREIMIGDAEAYGNQFPAYRDDPLKETLASVLAMNSEAFRRRYDQFRREMVFVGEPKFESAIATLGELADRLK
jgi:hypothetical protein